MHQGHAYQSSEIPRGLVLGIQAVIVSHSTPGVPARSVQSPLALGNIISPLPMQSSSDEASAATLRKHLPRDTAAACRFSQGSFLFEW